MQSHFQPEQEETERRYRPETVQKAAALAAKLQEEQRGTLTQSEVDQMASEIGIDPKLMRRALAAVAQSEGTQVHTRRQLIAPAFLVIAGIPGAFFLLCFLFLLLRAQPMSPATPVMVSTPVEAGTLNAGRLVENGDFEAGASATGTREKLARGTRSLPGWTVLGGEVLRISDASARGGHALQFGEKGRIQQIIPTAPNQWYRVRLSLSGRPGETRRLHRVQVRAGSNFGTLSVFTDGNIGNSVKWEQPSFEFQAQDSATLLTISPGPGDELGNGIPILDDVSVEPLGYTH